MSVCVEGRFESASVLLARMSACICVSTSVFATSEKIIWANERPRSCRLLSFRRASTVLVDGYDDVLNGVTQCFSVTLSVCLVPPVSHWICLYISVAVCLAVAGCRALS